MRKSSYTRSRSRKPRITAFSEFPRYSEAAVFSRLYMDFVNRLDSMRHYRDSVTTAREGVLLKIYEAQKIMVSSIKFKSKQIVTEYQKSKDSDDPTCDWNRHY